MLLRRSVRAYIDSNFVSLSIDSLYIRCNGVNVECVANEGFFTGIMKIYIYLILTKIVLTPFSLLMCFSLKCIYSDSNR